MSAQKARDFAIRVFAPDLRARVEDRLARAELQLAARGVPVFPCRPRGKEPLTQHGCRDATTDSETICRWRARWPRANVAIATGGVVRLLVVDVDGDEGEATLRRLESEHEPLPTTVEAITGGGGRHIYLRFPDGADLGNSAKKIGPGVDTRGSGGYVLAPPSLHPSGRPYAWSVDSADTIAEAPTWLLDLLQRTGGGKRPRTPPEEWQEIALQGVSAGARNQTITRLAGLLFRRLPDPTLAAELIACFNCVKCRPPLETAELKRTLDSIAARELRRREAL